MINLFVELGFQPLNMEALLDFELIERGSIFNNSQARDTIILIIFGKTKMLENMIIFIPEKVLIYRSLEIPVIPVIFLLNFLSFSCTKFNFHHGRPNINIGAVTRGTFTVVNCLFTTGNCI